MWYLSKDALLKSLLLLTVENFFKELPEIEQIITSLSEDGKCFTEKLEI